MTTTTRTERDQAVIERVRADLLSGRYFALIAQGNRSVPLGGAPITSRHWADMMVAVGTFARLGDRSADVAARIFGRINQYHTPNEAIAQVAEVLVGVVVEGWHDTRRATGPEPGRPSSHQHDTDLRSALWLALLMVEVEMSAGYIGHAPGIGWALRALVEEQENFTVHAAYLPKVAKALAA